jgi:hypothetical protein
VKLLGSTLGVFLYFPHGRQITVLPWEILINELNFRPKFINWRNFPFCILEGEVQCYPELRLHWSKINGQAAMDLLTKMWLNTYLMRILFLVQEISGWG